MTHSRFWRAITIIGAYISLALSALNPCFANEITASQTDHWTAADVFDVMRAAPILARMRITRAIPVKGIILPNGGARFYVEGNVTTLIRAPADLPAAVNWLVDIAPDSRGKLPRLKKLDALVAALPVAGHPASVQLAAPDAQVAWSAAAEARLRAAVIALTAPEAPPQITRVASAFYVPGTVPGESETQIFLDTETGAPASLSITRHAGEAPRWAVAFGEIVDDAAAPPARDTLAWYRLACFLPAALPAAATHELADTDAAAARADYGVVIAGLGPCARSRAYLTL